jgi:hypothetical protein
MDILKHRLQLNNIQMHSLKKYLHEYSIYIEQQKKHVVTLGLQFANMVFTAMLVSRAG